MDRWQVWPLITLKCSSGAPKRCWSLHHSAPSPVWIQNHQVHADGMLKGKPWVSWAPLDVPSIKIKHNKIKAKYVHIPLLDSMPLRMTPDLDFAISKLDAGDKRCNSLHHIGDALVLIPATAKTNNPSKPKIVCKKKKTYQSKVQEYACLFSTPYLMIFKTIPIQIHLKPYKVKKIEISLHNLGHKA